MDKWKKISIGDLGISGDTAEVSNIKVNSSDAAGTTSDAPNPFSNTESGIFTASWGKFANVASTIITPGFGSFAIINNILTYSLQLYQVYKAFDDKWTAITSILYHMTEENNDEANAYVSKLRKEKTREYIHKGMSD